MASWLDGADALACLIVDPVIVRVDRIGTARPFEQGLVTRRAMSARQPEAAAKPAQLYEMKPTDFAVGEVKHSLHDTRYLTR